MMWWMLLSLGFAQESEAPVRHEISGCVENVAALPASELFDPADARWKRDDILVVLKDRRRTMMFDKGVLATLDDGTPACWPVGLGAGYPSGHKQQMGDMRTPEGWYRTSDRPWSMFYHALTIHYPSAEDARRGMRDGLITKERGESIIAAQERGAMPFMESRLGGKILFHGGGGGSDWTLGCIALDDDNIDAMRARLPKSMRTWTLILP